MKQRRKPQSLPVWFDLAKYSTLKNASEFEWYTQIVIRRECWDFARHYNPALEEQGGPLPQMPESSAAHELLCLMRNDGVVRMEDIRRTCTPDVWGDHILGEFDRLKADIHPLTVEEAYLLRTGIVEQKRKEFDQYFIAELTPEGRSPYSRHIELKNSYHGNQYENSGMGDSLYVHQKEEFQQAGLSAISVNLRLPDSVLIDQFKRFLRESRTIADFRIRKTARRQTFRHWIEMRVVPYIDLTLWAHQTGTTITRPAMLDALFRHNPDCDEDTLRKVVRPLAAGLLNRHSAVFQQLKHGAANLVKSGTES